MKVIKLRESDIQRMVKRVLNEQTNTENVYIKREEPYPNTDWDLVHGAFGSKRLDDDLEKRVSKKLKSGDYRVHNIEINSENKGNEIITNGWVGLKPDSNNPHKHFTTRGSIGSNHKQRHDQQVSGLEGRLKNHFGGEVDTFGPYEVTINTDQEPITYTQSFFAIT